MLALIFNFPRLQRQFSLKLHSFPLPTTSYRKVETYLLHESNKYNYYNNTEVICWFDGDTLRHYDTDIYVKIYNI